MQKIALVTGAARRIGRHIALAMARDGWDVVVHYHHSQEAAEATAQEIIAMGRRAFTVACDLSEETAVQSLLADIENAFGLPQCVVNNASLFEYDVAQTFSYACFAEHAKLHVMAPVVLAQSLHLRLSQLQMPAAAGVVINLLDQKLFNPNPDYFSYTLSKAALHSATVLLAQALAPRLRVVGVAPGHTLISGAQSQASFEEAQRMAPLEQSSVPGDIAQAVCFLANARAITGVVVPVDGGQHLMPLPRDVMFLTDTP